LLAVVSSRNEKSNFVNHRCPIDFYLSIIFISVAGILLGSCKNSSSQGEAGVPGQVRVESLSKAAGSAGESLEPRNETASPGQPDELVAGLLKAMAGKDQAAISRYTEAIMKAGTVCIGSIRASLIVENDAETAKKLAYLLTRISTPDAYTATVEAATLAGNKDTKYVVLDMLKATLNKENSGYLIKLALSGNGDVPGAAADLIASSGNSDLLAGLVNSANSPEERKVAAAILRNSLSPESARVLQECAMLPDDTLGKAAVAGLASQSSEESTTLLLNSFKDYGPAPNPDRFQYIVEELHNMLQQNPDKPGLAITIESLMTSSDSSVARAAAAAALSNAPEADKAALSEAFQKALKFETDPQVRPFFEQGIRRINQRK
jgi:hypothetical protein